MPTIKPVDHLLTVEARGYVLRMDLQTALAALRTPQGNLLFEFPLDVRLETLTKTFQLPKPLRVQVDTHRIVLSPAQNDPAFKRQELHFTLDESTFHVHFEAQVDDPGGLSPTVIEYFRDPEVGMRLNTMKRGFFVPNAPLSEEDYHNLFPLTSLRGLASPPVLTVGMEFAAGFVGLGLLDLSDATSFGIVHPVMGLRVDAQGGNRTWSAGDTYQGPRVAVFFPPDGWEGIRQFRELLARDGQLPSMDTPRPEWWKRGTYCTYGDQIMAHQPALYTARYWDSPLYSQPWVREAVLNAERRLGRTDFTVIIDAFWQRAWDTDPVPDPVRFPFLRELIDELHERGHKVLLWYAPHGVDAASPEKGKLARAMGLLGRNREPAQPPVGLPELTLLDYTAPGAEDYLHEVARKLFSADPDGLNADGLKMDFLFLIPQTEQPTAHQNPELGMGFRLVQRYLTLFQGAARAVKADVLLNYSAGDPRLASRFGIHRLHDTKVTYRERERRARVSALANPDLPIDSDGAVMFDEWLMPTYIAAAVYGTPCLYYAETLNDGQRLSDADMKTLGRLFGMVARRDWGRPEFLDYGCWRLRDREGQVIGESYDGKLCWLKTGPHTATVLGFRDQAMAIDLYRCPAGTVTPLPDDLKVEGSRIFATWKGGQPYDIRW